MNELDHLNVALSGTNLIEASAGTGKTYAIAFLYLRLLLEQDLLPEQILVVTYTEAATKELRGRIRNRIREALSVLDGAATDDPLLKALIDRLRIRPEAVSRARARLDAALRLFDTASIFTIHGFCQRVLQDNAFESGTLYSTELVTDRSQLIQEIADDFWRQRFFGDSSPLLAQAVRCKLSPETCAGFLKQMLGNATLEVIPHYTEQDIQESETGCVQAFAALRIAWLQNRFDIEDLLLNDKRLSRGPYRRDLIPGLMVCMDAYCSSDNPYDLPDELALFSSSGICAGTQPSKRSTPPEHPLFDLCEELVSQAKRRFLVLHGELLAFARKQLVVRKKQQNIRFFDDLLNDLYAALSGPAGKKLAAAVRGGCQAALIDEFQDTDPVQYEIFRMIYCDSGNPLFLIGDPKQAIYSFRGADIFAYIQAKQNVPETKRFTLTGNFRSAPELLTAFNTVFDTGGRTFLYDSIPYHRVSSGREEEGNRLLVARDREPLQVWLIPSGDDGKPLATGKAGSFVADSVAGEITKLLQDGQRGNATIAGAPVLPGDIAVIVRDRFQARSVQQALIAVGVPCIMRSTDSIFVTGEAADLCTLLRGVADPGNEKRVRAALVTGIMGLKGDDIARLNDDEQAWEERLGQFRAYHQSWLAGGFIAMARGLLSREGVRGRLLSLPGGERMLTNLMQCIEVLHQKAHDDNLGCEGLLTWFSERISDQAAKEEFEIRLETDEKAVRIVTTHVSKGLEYPVVFCPFLWGGMRDAGEIATFHRGSTMVKDFGSDDILLHRQQAQEESLAEELRLLYVALTRAKYRCYLYAGKINTAQSKAKSEKSALAYLFHSSESTRAAEQVVDILADEVKKLTAPEMESQLRELGSRSSGTIGVRDAASDGVPYQPDTGAAGEIACRNFTGNLNSSWRVTSFTGFASHSTQFLEQPDRDESREGEATRGSLPEEIPEGRSIFTFPRGAQAGIFLHELFENLNFAAAPRDHIDELVMTGLAQYGYGQEWLPPISTMVANVITTPLSAPGGPFTLADLKPGSWIPELEFFFPLAFITSELLGSYLTSGEGRGGAADLSSCAAALKFKPVEGMVRGFMDMVFEHGGRYYLLDWKSNHLGYRVEDYGPNAVKAAMEHNLYPLQYLLYTVALNRYLSLRVRDYDYATHFGGVIYLFLRGVTPAYGETYGLFRDTPPVGLIDTLTNGLIHAGG